MGYQIRNVLAFCNCDPCCSSDLVSPKRSATGPQFRRWILVANVNVKVTSGCCIGRRALQVCNFSANHPQKIGNGSLLSPAPNQKSDSATTQVFLALPTIGYNGCKLPEIPKSALWQVRLRHDVETHGAGFHRCCHAWTDPMPRSPRL